MEIKEVNFDKANVDIFSVSITHTNLPFIFNTKSRVQGLIEQESEFSEKVSDLLSQWVYEVVLFDWQVFVGVRLESDLQPSDPHRSTRR